jgi:antibiotic biosynthesis monooxygenase (ABM) superfamily enzyme
MKSIIGVSLLTLTGLYGLLVAFILLIGILLGANLGPLLLIAIIVLLLQFLLSPFFTDLTMKWFYKAKFDNQLPDYLNTFVKDLCNKHTLYV